METAKVDIRKLQLLNDRVNQCIDALNQVRVSVHGLSHTTGAIPGIQAGLNPLVQNPGFGPGYPAFTQFGQIPITQPLTQTFVPGLSHTTGQIGTSPMLVPGVTAVPGIAATAWNPYLGLSHTSPELEHYPRPVWADPFLAARIAQTFPYAQYAFPPVVTIY